MSFRQFLESFQSDTVYRKVANDFFDKLLDYIKAKGDLTKVPSLNGFAINGNKLDKNYNIAILLTPPSKKVNGIIVKAGFGNWKGMPIIMMNVLKGEWDAGFLDQRLMTFKHEFIHEFIHYMDSIRWKTGKMSSAEKVVGNIKEYYNTPEEFNAYYQEGVDKILTRFTKRIPNKTKQKYLKSYETFFNNIVTLGFDKDFVDALNDKYKKKLQKRLADVYTDLKEKA